MVEWGMTDSVPHNTIPLTSIDLSATRLVNKEYYNAIAAKMAAMRNPTVRDEIEAMCAQGNTLYVKNWKGFKEGSHEPQFKPNRHTHEIAHLCARIPHSMQGEVMGLAFEAGLAFGLDLRQLSAEGLAIYAKGAKEGAEIYTASDGPKYQKEEVKPLSKRDWAIYTAAGMYLREKMDCFIREQMLRHSYQEQQEWCEKYTKRDQLPLHRAKQTLAFPDDFHLFDEENPTMNACMKAPNALIHLSPKEWREIEAVALGMAEPEQTAYPNRLAAVKEALVHVGMFFDRPKFPEAHEAETIRKNQHARIGNSYPATSQR